jgi:2-oxo-hept-3-ene-1,7-dioate hydratase
MTGTLSTEHVAALAREHQVARATAAAIDQPTLRYPDMNLDDAYAVQQAWIDLDLASGRTVVGHKVGLTSKAMQQQMKIDRPDYGTLLNDMVFEPGSTLDAAQFIDPRIEVELAFVLATTLAKPDVGLEDVLAATDYVVPAVELIDARSHRVDPASGRARTVIDTISDNAANAGIITGGTRRKPSGVDLRWVGAALYLNGVVEETGLASGVLNHPANGVAWLANTQWANGVALEAGQVILAGSFTRAVMAKPGDEFLLDFGPLGSFTLAFA